MGSGGSEGAGTPQSLAVMEQALGAVGIRGAGTPQSLAGATACRVSLVLETPGV